MNADDVRLLDRVMEKTDNNKMKYILCGSGFSLYLGKQCLGMFETAELLLEYLCGYETGFSKGKYVKK